jgi:hypothetical protein
VSTSVWGATVAASWPRIFELRQRKEDIWRKEEGGSDGGATQSKMSEPK